MTQRGDVLTEESIITSLRAFIFDRFPLARKKAITNQSLLLQSGIVDSLGILELVAFMEREFSIAIDDDELIPKNFSNIEASSSFVMSKLGMSSEPGGKIGAKL
jgi:acyl carrier protein